MDYNGSCLVLSDQLYDEQWYGAYQLQPSYGRVLTVEDLTVPVDNCEQRLYQNFQQHWDMNHQMQRYQRRESASYTSATLESVGRNTSGFDGLGTFNEQPVSSEFRDQDPELCRLHLSTQHQQHQLQLYRSCLDVTSMSVNCDVERSLQYLDDISTMSSATSSHLPPAPRTTSCRLNREEENNNVPTFIGCHSTVAFPPSSSSGSVADNLPESAPSTTTSGIFYGREQSTGSETFDYVGLPSSRLLSVTEDCRVGGQLAQTSHQPSTGPDVHANTELFEGCYEYVSAVAIDVKPELDEFSANASNGYGNKKTAVEERLRSGFEVVADISNHRIRSETTMSSSPWAGFRIESASSASIENVSTGTSRSVVTSSGCYRSRSSSMSCDQSSETETSGGVCVGMVTNGDDVMRRKRRREQNRRAARKCREKKKENVDGMKIAYGRTKAENDRLRVEKNKLQMLVSRLQEVMRVHMEVCSLIAHPPSTLSPHGLLYGTATASVSGGSSIVGSQYSVVSSILDLVCE